MTQQQEYENPLECYIEEHGVTQVLCRIASWLEAQGRENPSEDHWQDAASHVNAIVWLTSVRKSDPYL